LQLQNSNLTGDQAGRLKNTPMPPSCATVRKTGILENSRVQSMLISGEYQGLPANVDFANAAGKYIAHAKLLVPAWTAGCELPLLFSEMKVVAPRLVINYFANAGNPDKKRTASPGAGSLLRKIARKLPGGFNC
jgi:hypothetical protein